LPANVCKVGIPENGAASLRSIQGIACALGNELPFLFSKRCVQLQHERIGVGAEFGNDEANFVRHQTADEMHVTG